VAQLLKTIESQAPINVSVLESLCPVMSLASTVRVVQVVDVIVTPVIATVVATHLVPVFAYFILGIVENLHPLRPTKLPVPFMEARPPALIVTAVIDLVPPDVATGIEIVAIVTKIFNVLVPSTLYCFPVKEYSYVPAPGEAVNVVLGVLTIVIVPSDPTFTFEVATSVIVVVAQAVPMPSKVRPPAGTNNAAPTQRTRIINRDFMMDSFR
jgi:hypothetical protein